MKSSSLTVLPLATVLLCAGCGHQPFLSAPTVSAGEEQRPRANGMTLATARVLGGKLKPGMTESQVLAVMGAPDGKGDRIFPLAPKPEIPELHWFYRWSIYVGYHLDLAFELRGGQWVLRKGSWGDG